VHGRAVRNLTKDEALYETLVTDYTKAPVSPADRAMLDYSAKLTLTPGKMDPHDVEALRDHEFSDSAIGDIAMHVSFFSVMNRMVDGLGGDVSDETIQEAERLGMTIPDHLRDQNHRKE
jgi:uncharacterized peroxidase-related enzyme